MPRRVPENRLKDLLACATRVFIAQGYRRTQMADVAAALGVAKGTVYLYVESKEALFEACLRHADEALLEGEEPDLPLSASPPGVLARTLREALGRSGSPPALERALRRRRVGDVRAELEEILRELYALSNRHRTSIKLLDRCGRDHPELEAIFYAEGRFAQLHRLTRYVELRAGADRLRAVARPAVAARFVIESIATWAVHIHWDRAPQEIDPHDARETVVDFLLAGLLPAESRPRAEERSHS